MRKRKLTIEHRPEGLRLRYLLPLVVLRCWGLVERALFMRLASGNHNATLFRTQKPLHGFLV